MASLQLFLLFIFSIASQRVTGCTQYDAPYYDDPTMMMMMDSSGFDDVAALTQIMDRLDEINAESNPNPIKKNDLTCIENELLNLSITDFEQLVLETRDGRNFTVNIFSKLNELQRDVLDENCGEEDFGVCRVVMHCITDVPYEELLVAP